MAENEEKDLELEDPEDAPEIEEGQEDTTDYKALAIKNAAIAKRNKTKLEKLKLKNAERKGEDNANKAKQNEPDYAKLAYLEGKGITSDEDIAWAEQAAQDSGKSLRELFGAKWFQAELKERREETASKEAIPSGSKRSANATRDTVDYWIAKGELPPANQRDLREKVVAQKRKIAAQGNQFSENPIV